MATLKDGTTVGGSLVHTHKTLPILIIDGNLTHGGAVVFDTKNRPSFSSLTDNVIDVRTDSVIINTSKGNTSATIYDNGVFELKKAHVPYFTVEATGNIIGKIEWSRVQSKPIVGTTGTSTTNIMHQKAVTDNLNKKLNIGDFGVGSWASPSVDNKSDLDDVHEAGFYHVPSGISNTPIGSESGDSLIEWGWGKTFRSQMFITNKNGFLHTRGQQNGKWRKWNQLATLDQLNKINDGIKNRLIKDGGKLITTGSAETLLDEVEMGDYNQYMFTNNQYLGLESPTNFYIQTMEAEDQSIVQMGYPIMTQRAKERGVPNRIIMRNRSPWRDATNAIKRHDWTDWSLTLVNQDLTKSIANSVANASDEKIPTEKAIRTELNKMIVGGTVVNGQGTSTVNVMSQRATTEGLNTKWDIVTNTGYAPNKSIDDYVAGEGGYTRSSNGAPLGGLDIITKSQYGTNDLLQIGFPQRINKNFMMRTKGSGGWGEWFEFYHTANTQVDSKGVIHNGTRKPTDVLLTGDYGLGGFADIIDTDLNDKNLVSTGLSSYYVVSTKNVPTTVNGTMISIMHDVKKQWGSQFFIETSTGDSYIRTTSHLTNWDKWRKLYDDGNTTKDKNGVIHDGTKTPLDTLNTSNVVQTGGSSTSNVPSQKFVTDEFKKVNDNLNTVIGTTVVELKADIAKKWDIQTTTGTGDIARVSVTDALSTRINTAQTTADNALAKAQNLKDLTNVATARTNLGLGSSAIRNISTAEGTSTAIVASQALVNNVKIQLNTEIGKKADTSYVNTELGKKRDWSNNNFPSIHIRTDEGRSTYGLSAGGIPFVSIKVGDGAEQYANFQNKTGTIALTSDVSSNKVKYALVKTWKLDRYNIAANNPFGNRRIWGYGVSSDGSVKPIYKCNEKYIFVSDDIGLDVHVWTDV